MTLIQTFPQGTESLIGVDFVRKCAEELNSSHGTCKMKSISSIRDLVEKCSAVHNPSAYKNCQQAALTAISSLAKLANDCPVDSGRIVAFEAIGVVMFGADEKMAK